MLTKRIIPCLDIDKGRVVKGVSFLNLRDAGDPAELAQLYNESGADELVFLDITASSDDRATMVDVVQRVSSQVFIPLTVGGGIRSVDDARRMLEAGADKVSINSAAVARPELIVEASREFGAQCIVLAIDARRDPRQRMAAPEDPSTSDSLKWRVYTHGGRRATSLEVIEWAQRGADLGAGELLVTSMDTDGQRKGYDLELLRAISSRVDIPLIASGGAGTLEHLRDALLIGKADAVLAASIFHYGEFSVWDAKKYLSQQGLPIRLPQPPFQRASSCH